MKKCPFCGADIEDSARFCLYCMQPLTEKEQILPRKKKKPQWLPIIAAIVGVFFLFIILLPGKQAAPENGATTESHSLNTAPSSTPAKTDIPHSAPATAPVSQPTTIATAPTTIRTTTTITTPPTVPTTTRPTTAAATQPTVPTTTRSTTATTAQPTVPTTTRPTTAAATQPTVPTTTRSTTATTTQPTVPTTAQPTTQPHEHSFSVKNITKKYLLAEADCIYPATYYYSCFCGEKGSSTFYWGEAKGHTKVTASGTPADCVNTGLSDRTYCSVCNQTFISHSKLPALGHTFALGDSTATCLDCGEHGTLTINTPAFPHIVNDTYRINSGTYNLKFITDGTWMLNFTFDYTNISSQDTVLGPIVSLLGVAQGSNHTAFLKPGQSGTFGSKLQIDDPNGTYDLVLE